MTATIRTSALAVVAALFLMACHVTCVRPPTSTRNSAASKWKEVARFGSEALVAQANVGGGTTPAPVQRTVKMLVGLRQNNLAVLEQLVHNVSDPDHEQYGQHFTTARLAALVGHPHTHIQQAVAAIKQKAGGTMAYQVADTQDAITFRFTPAQAFQLLEQDVVTYANEALQLQYDAPEHWDQAGRLDGYLPEPALRMLDVLVFPPTYRRYRPPAQPLQGLTDQVYFVAHGLDSSVQILFPVLCRRGFGRNAPPYCATDDLTSVTLPYRVLPPQGAASNKTVSSANYTATAPFENCGQYPIYFGSAQACSLVVPDLPNFYAVSVSQLYYGYASGFTAYISSTQTPIPAPLASPEFLQSLYNIPASYVDATNTANRQAAVEFDAGENYVPTDLQKFLDDYNIPASASVVTVVGVNPVSTYALPDSGEGPLDVQTMVGLTGGNVATDYIQVLKGPNQVGTLATFTQFANSYLSSATAAKVVSISYGAPDALVSPAQRNTVNRFNRDCMKAAAVGITVVASSGDDGALIPPAQTCSQTGHCTPNCRQFTANFPASAPYVTAVGGTELSLVYSSACAAKAMGCASPQEIMASSQRSSLITSGGGFSKVFAQPAWQKSQVQAYLKAQGSANLPPSSVYQASGRAVPDVAALAHNFPTVLNGTIYPIDGTSASAPTFAAMVALVNTQRLNSGKSTLGFVNPALYKLASSTPAAFNDVTYGENNCASAEVSDFCCNYGFTAAAGWDPVTGLGSVNFETLAGALS